MKVIKRLSIAWVTLSLVIGGVVFYLELRKAEDFVLRLAIEESESFTAHNLDHFNRPGAERDSELVRKAEEFLKRHFILIRLYNRHKQPILQATAPGTEALVAELQKHLRLFPLGDGIQHSSAFLHQRVLMHVLLPLKEQDGGLAGYFEGVYQVDDETVENIRNEVIGALALVVLVTLAAAVALYPVIISLNRELIKFSSDLLKGNIELMQVLGSAIALRDADTGVHNYRVTLYAVRLAEHIGLNKIQMRKLIAGAFLHDVGKIGVSDTILLKPGRHTDEESRVMRTHVSLGVDILRKSAWLQNARDVVECHHERYDGSGYPRGLQGEAIPLNARIFAIADVFVTKVN